MSETQLEVFSPVDLYTDEELGAAAADLDRRISRLRGLVLKGRVPRQAYDDLVAERDSLTKEAARRHV